MRESDDHRPPATDREVCTRCGTTIDTNDWYPIATERIDESIELYPFCSDDCKEAWADGRTD